MPSFSLGCQKIPCTCAGVDGSGFDDDTAIFDQFLYMCAGVGIANLGLLSGVEPDFSFSDACDAGGKALL